MSKISIIIQREYLTRVKKKSFIIMTLLAPLFMAAMFIVPVWIMTRDDAEEKVIAVVEDETNLFKDVIPNSKYLKFEYLVDVTLDDLKTNFSDKGYYAVLHISPKVAYIPNAVQLISHKQPPLDLTIHIANALEKEIEQKKLEAYDIKDLDKILKAVSTNINVQTIKISDDGIEKETSTGLAMGIAYIGGLLIYILTFIFGAQVMRGVIEEKTSRVVEVIISSVRPFQLMMGKILGIGLVGLTQFVLWIIITAIIITAAQSFLLPDDIGQTTQAITENIMSSTPVEQTQVPIQTQEFNEIQQVFNSLHSINWGLILSSFLFYFLGGYFLYASLFAAVGSAVDNETDTQQFMMPITIPLILGLFVAMGTFQNPESSVAFWFSFIPLTSPIVMMARLPFGVPYWELILSMIILILTFLGTTWLAAKIYRTGILMYGKKTTYKELWKWLRYKN
ncbi:MAG: ABC transporter permease [Bacteroidales bacterium]|nr:ABC transporter permease [Bacteroidales bacterium]